MGLRFSTILLVVFLLVNLGTIAEAVPATTAQQHGGLWITHGPRGGRALALEVSPHFAGDGVAFSGEWLTSYRSTESGSGIVRSADAGQGWRVSDAGTKSVLYASAVHDFAFSDDFTADSTVFAATWGGLFKSVDQGVSWSWLEGAYEGPPGGYTSIAAAPDYSQSGQVLAGDMGGLLRSNDGGEHWERQSDVGAAADIVYAPGSGSDKTVFASDGASVYRSEDAAQSWTPVLTAPVTSLAVSPAFTGDQTVFAAGGAHVYTSIDGGANWISHTVDTGVTMINALAVSPQFAGDATLFAGASNGLFRSHDGGVSWTAIPAYTGVAVHSLAISPQWPQHSVLLVGADAGVYRLLSADISGGAVKQPAAGFMPLAASPLAWSAEAGLFLTATSNHGVYGSGDDGQTWQAMGLQTSSSYYSFSDVAISPDYASDGTLFASWLSGTGIGGSVYRSRDEGATWENVYSTDYVGDLAISPAFASDQTVFATSGDDGLVRSTDGGEEWQPVGQWPGGAVHGIAQYVAFPPEYPADPTLFTGGSRGFWRLPAGETTWQPALTGLGSEHTVFSLAVSPDFANDSTLLALAYWPAPTPTGQLYGAFISTDGGDNWQQSSVGSSGDALFDVTFSPAFAQNQTAYVSTAGGELYRSEDGGHSWVSLGTARGEPPLYDVVVREDGSIFVGSEEGVWQYIADPYSAYLPLFHGRMIAQ